MTPLIATTIKFLGLLIVTQLTNSGAHIVMGHLPGLTNPHDSIIAYQPADLVGQSNWKKDGSFVSGGVAFDYVRVNKENISFSGPTDAFVNSIGPMPHLSCCCPTMRGLKPVFGNPAEGAGTKMAAHFILDHGLFTTIPQSDGAVGTGLAFVDQKPLTITGTIGAVTRRLVLRFGANVIVANTPLATLEGRHTHTGSVRDFDAYYAMGIDSSACRMAPSDGPPCAPQSNACAAPEGRARSAAPARPKLTKRQNEIVAFMKGRCMTCKVGDINCSSSQWP